MWFFYPITNNKYLVEMRIISNKKIQMLDVFNQPKNMYILDVKYQIIYFILKKT